MGWGLEHCPGLGSRLCSGTAGQASGWSLQQQFPPAPTSAEAPAAIPSLGTLGCQWGVRLGGLLRKQHSYSLGAESSCSPSIGQAAALAPATCAPSAGAAPVHPHPPSAAPGGTISPRSASGSAIYKHSSPSSAGTLHLPALHHCHPKNHGLETSSLSLGCGSPEMLPRCQRHC